MYEPTLPSAEEVAARLGEKAEVRAISTPVGPAVSIVSVGAGGVLGQIVVEAGDHLVVFSARSDSKAQTMDLLNAMSAGLKSK